MASLKLRGGFSGTRRQIFGDFQQLRFSFLVVCLAGHFRCQICVAVGELDQSLQGNENSTVKVDAGAVIPGQRKVEQAIFRFTDDIRKPTIYKSGIIDIAGTDSVGCGFGEQPCLNVIFRVIAQYLLGHFVRLCGCASIFEEFCGLAHDLLFFVRYVDLAQVAHHCLVHFLNDPVRVPFRIDVYSCRLTGHRSHDRVIVNEQLLIV